MPLAEEKLAEKIPFDVYAVMLVLSALFTIGAILMMNTELRTDWYGAEPPWTKKADHVTKLNAQTDEEKTTNGASPWTQITEEDIADYPLLPGGMELKTTPYPDWLKVNTDGVKFVEKIGNQGEFPLDTIPEAEREALKSSYVSEVDATAGVLEEKSE